jgi:hypothetical protein
MKLSTKFYVTQEATIFLTNFFSVFENVQAMDEYGNAVEEGQKIRLRLDGFQFQDKQGTERKVF